MNRNIVTRETLKKRGPDGGLDLLITISAKTPLAARQVAGKVWRIIEAL